MKLPLKVHHILYPAPWIGLLGIFFILNPGSISAQSFTVPIKFKIEDGSFDDSQILVQRNGVTSQTIPGKDRLTLELAYNVNYVISFVKPGYITKKISINTSVSADRQAQGFEPYAYGVNLFKQYDGVNTVIFNQPVAKISYSKKIDDFDYDVDYTKSVQSEMKKAEDETQKQAVIAKAREEETKVIDKQKAVEVQKQKLAEQKKADEDLKKQKAEEIEAKKTAELKAKEEEVKKKESEKAEALKQKAMQIAADEDKKRAAKNAADEEKQKQALVAAGEDKKPPPKAAAGDDANARKLVPAGGEDEKVKLKIKTGEEVKKPSGFMVSGSDPVPAKKLIPVIGKDLSLKDPEPVDDGGITVEEINEPNRTITKVSVRRTDGMKYVYTKIAYNWGGTYYFRNSTLSITEYIYQLYTRMK